MLLEYIYSATFKPKLVADGLQNLSVVKTIFYQPFKRQGMSDAENFIQLID